jgi:hypothetical protein
VSRESFSASKTGTGITSKYVRSNQHLGRPAAHKARPFLAATALPPPRSQVPHV